MLSLKTEHETIRELRENLRRHRLALGWRQADLARRSGVGIVTLRRFERTGRVGLPVLIKLLVTLGLSDRFLAALPKAAPAPRDIDEFLKPKRVRQRAPRKSQAG